MNAELQFEITNFLNNEAFLLDSMRFEEWLNLLTDDIIYRMPLRVTREAKDGSNIIDDMSFFEESKKSLTTRVKRLGTKSAWALDPVPRTRHFVSNIIIEEGTKSNELKVKSCFLFKRSRGIDHSVEELFGERVDVLRKVDEQWNIASRTIYADQAILTVQNLSMFL